MAAIIAVVTDAARRYYPQFFGRMLGISASTSTVGNWNPLLKSFKIGRGGWINSGSGKVPRTPSPLLTDLDIILDAGRSAPDKRYSTESGNIYYYEKALDSIDFTYNSTTPYTLGIRCRLGGSEFNDIQGTPSTPPGGATLPAASVSPEAWELGIFSDHPSGTGQLMVLYATFPGEVKLSGSLLENTVFFSF